MPEDSGKRQLNEKQRKTVEEFRTKHDQALRRRAAHLTGPRFVGYVPDLVQGVMLKLAKRINSNGIFEDEQARPIVDVLGYAKTILKRDYWALISSSISKEDSLDNDSSEAELMARAARRLDAIAYDRFFQYERERNTVDHYRALLQKLIQRLDVELQEVVKLRMFEHIEFDEIALILKLRPDVVKYTMNLARARLRYWLKQELRREL